MAQLTVYASEPATKGKVVLHTSLGPFDVELWSKEAPLACRNFVQLGLEGYYDGCIFHRVIKEFMAQTGDPTGTGTGGDSSFGGHFKDEVHGRLRFTHRGLLAMASSGPDTNGSQFFITLDRCEWLNNKHTIFGKVTGNSLYNLGRFDELELEANDRPCYPPRIQRFEVLLEPFDDIVPRPRVLTEASDHAPKKKKKKEKKNLSLLSFGEEAAEEERALQQVSSKVVSSHDLLDDPRLSRQQAVTEEELAQNVRKRDAQAAASDALKSRAVAGEASEEGAHEDFTDRMRQRMQERRHRLEAEAKEQRANGSREKGSDALPANVEGAGDDDPQAEYEKLRQEVAANRRAAADQEPEAGKGWKWRGKGDADGADSDDDDSDHSDDGAAGASILEKRRAKFVKQKRQNMMLSKRQRQDMTLQKLAGFRSTLGASAAEGENDSWKTHVLKFEREHREAESASVYDSVDPLKHGVDSSRATAKIKERERTMLSMKKGWVDAVEED